MKVLVVNQYFPPDSSATAAVFLDLTNALLGRGHEPVVFCGRPSYDPVPGGADAIPAGVTVERVWSTSFDRRRMVGRLMNYVSFLVSSRLKVLLRRYRADAVVVGTDPPLAVRTALKLARGAPVVYSLQDLHPEAALTSGWVRPGAGTRVWEKLHRRSLRRVAAVAAIGHDMKERLIAKGVDPQQIRVIPNGAWPPSDPVDGSVVAAIRGDRSFVVMHAGNVGAVGAWDSLIEAGRRLEGGAELVFVGGGAKAHDIEAAGIEVQPFRPVHEVPSVMAAGDLQIVSMAAGMEGISVPSKLYTILANGRPVLAVVPTNSEVADVVRRFGCGYVVDPADPGAVVAAVERARSDPGELAAMADAAASAGREFHRGACMGRLVDLVEEVG